MGAFAITQYHGEYNRTHRGSAPTYIVVHYTGSGTSKAGSALANCQYFSRADRQASAHYFIDDGSIYEYADPAQWATWHCGDGHGKYGITNANSIGIEVCNNGGPYTGSEIERLAYLVGVLMERFGIDAAHVVRHYDASRKACPKYYVDNPSAWAELHRTITEGDVLTDADKNDIANLVVSKIKEEKSDPTGRGMNVNIFEHVKWLAAAVAGIGEKLDKLADKIDATTAKLMGDSPEETK